jgi:uncharacterized protein (DUF302 family)
LKSRYDFAGTVELLQNTVKDAGNTVFAVIDQAAAAESVGLQLRPTTLIVFGNPKGGTPLMEAFPRIALELPLKILIWQESGAVSVAYTPMSEIAARYGIDLHDSRIDAMDRAIAALVQTVTE